MTGKIWKRYPSDVTEEEWWFVLPYLLLCREDDVDGQSGKFDLEPKFTVRCDGACFIVHGWLVDMEILNEPAEWVI